MNYSEWNDAIDSTEKWNDIMKSATEMTVQISEQQAESRAKEEAYYKRQVERDLEYHELLTRLLEQKRSSEETEAMRRDNDFMRAEMLKSDVKCVAMRAELAELLNRYSQENASNTPDFILAEYLLDCLNAFDRAIRRREEWYGVK